MNITDISAQLQNIIPSLGLGFVLGIVYEIIRILRLYISENKVFVFISDMLFVILCSVSFFVLFVAVNNGHIRFYMLISGLLGYVVCLFTIGELLFSCFAKLKSVLIKVLKPIFKPFVLLNMKISLKLKKIFEKILNKLKKLLKHSHKVVYNKPD